MTRGKIIFLGDDQKVYTTVEFNGDMYPEGHGDEIIQAYEDGHLRDVGSFYNFIARFDRRNFHYAEYAGEVIRWTLGKESKIFDVRENWTDYLYIVNESGEKYTLLTSEGERSLNTSQMAIVYFQQLKMIKDGEMAKKKEATFMISKKEFSSILKRMKETHELIDDIDTRLRKFPDGQIRDFCSGAGIVITNEEYVMRLLALLTEDKYGDIDYFAYELKYGEEYREGCITREDGGIIDLSCAEKLYDYLVAEKIER